MRAKPCLTEGLPTVSADQSGSEGSPCVMSSIQGIAVEDGNLRQPVQAAVPSSATTVRLRHTSANTQHYQKCFLPRKPTLDALQAPELTNDRRLRKDMCR